MLLNQRLIGGRQNVRLQNTVKPSGRHSLIIISISSKFDFSLFPEYDQALNNLANLLKSRGEIVEAERLLRRALKIRPDFPAAWMNLGIVVASTKRFSEAEKCYFNALKLRKHYPDCYYNIGNLVKYFHTKKLPEVIYDFSTWNKIVCLRLSRLG